MKKDLKEYQLMEQPLLIVHRIHRWFATHRPFSRITLRLFPKISIRVHGVEFYVYPGQRNYSEVSLWRMGEFSEKKSLEELLRRIIGKKSFILDIGANVGIFSVILCKYASRESILHAFEPNPKMAVKLRKNLGINALITAFKVHEAAIGGDSEGYTELNICAKNAGESSLKGIDFSDEKIVVPIKPLNDLLAQAPSDAQVVIKCDVEGYEYEVFAPLFEGTSLRFPDIILLEVEHKARWEFDLIEKLLHLGYKIEFEGEGNCLLIRHNL